MKAAVAGAQAEVAEIRASKPLKDIQKDGDDGIFREAAKLVTIAVK
jgi:hypothetical protein